ncbi:hypothetical protein [Streptomyces sp. 2P-4]|uniref:hypothetical protein n=1 Tax=Streptomyces sp. 2P-4 TaxID=2931974 RepID=UPI00253F85F6|nr:hypothetical protein [Streptomyces sp. 2P-4]
MATHLPDDDSRLSLWLRVRRYAVPPSVIHTATARRSAGDWAGACAAAGVDVDLHLPSVARTYGRDCAARLRADLRHLAPDLLRWHMPRTAPDGLLRPGLTVALARYAGTGPDGTGSLYLVVRTPPAWADAGQRIVLGLWDRSRPEAAPAARRPHPRPARRFRLDLHRHLWDARRAGELRHRSGADRPPGTAPAPALALPPGRSASAAPAYRCAPDLWPDEAGLLLRADGLEPGPVEVRLGSRHRLVIDPATGRPAAAPAGGLRLPVLPDAAAWVPPDLELLRAGLIGPDRLHPLVAGALVPGHVPAGPPPGAEPDDGPRHVDCRGSRHRIGLVDGVLAALDHGPDELRREELLVALTGTPLPCLRAIDRAHRRPESLPGIRERLAHGDTAGALEAVESLLGPGAVLRDGLLRDELESAARQRITYGLYRAGLVGPGPGRGPAGAGGEPPARRVRPSRARQRTSALFY